MAAREEKLDQGYQSYQKWGGIQKRIYLVERPSRQEIVGESSESSTNPYEFRADNKGLFINDKAMQGFRIASGFRKAHHLTA